MSAPSAITGAGFAMGYPVNAGAGRVLRRQIDVLQADLPPRHQLAVLGPRNVDLPELLGGALVNRFRDHPNSTPDQRTREAGDVVDPDRELPTFQHRRRRAHAGSALDGLPILALRPH